MSADVVTSVYGDGGASIRIIRDRIGGVCLDVFGTKAGDAHIDFVADGAALLADALVGIPIDEVTPEDLGDIPCFDGFIADLFEPDAEPDSCNADCDVCQPEPKPEPEATEALAEAVLFLTEAYIEAQVNAASYRVRDAIVEALVRTAGRLGDA